MVVFCGAARNKFLFNSEYKLVTSWWPRSMKNALNFPTSIRTKQDPLNKKRRFLNEILNNESLRRYVPVMDSTTRHHLETHWTPHRVLNVFPLIKKYSVSDFYVLKILDIIGKTKFELSENNGVTTCRDLLSSMFMVADENGNFMNEMEICNHIIGSLIASHHATSTAIAFVMKYLAELPHYREVFKGNIQKDLILAYNL